MSSKDPLSFIIITTWRALKMHPISVDVFILLISTVLLQRLEVEYTSNNGCKDWCWSLRERGTFGLNFIQ